jgi:DHA2 family methylenomycin A resistance protein-like MFS transporter
MSEPRSVVGGALLHVPHPHPGPTRSADARIRPGAVLATSCLVLFVIGVNTTAINTALNALAGDLDMGSSALGWAVGIYLLAAAAFVVLGGRLCDLIGERSTMLLGLAIFVTGAVLVAVAHEPWTVIFGRFLQGSGSACLMPASMAVLRVAYPPERQGFALGIWGAVGGVAFAVGPLIGGAFTDVLSWRWVWWSTILVGAGLAVLASTTLRSLPAPAKRPTIDIAGVVLLPIPLFALILAIQQGSAWGWTAPITLAVFALSAVGLVVLVAVESRRDVPLLHLKLLRVPALAAANLGTFINGVFLIGLLYFFNLYLQAVVTLDYSAVLASVALLPYGICAFLASLIIGRVCDRVGFRWPIAGGLVLMGIGALLLTGIDANSGYGNIWWCTIPLGFGVGATFSAPSAAGLRAVSDEQAGEAAGIINVVRYVGAALAVSIGTAVFVGVGSDQLNDQLQAAGVPTLEREKLDKVLTGAPAHVEAAERSLDATDRKAFEAGAAEGVADGFAVVMLGLGIVALLGSLAWVALMRDPREARGP